MQLLAVVRRWRKFNSDLPALLDEWASRCARQRSTVGREQSGTLPRPFQASLLICARRRRRPATRPAAAPTPPDPTHPPPPQTAFATTPSVNFPCSLFRELDYRHEAANGVRFRELYGHMEVGSSSGGACRHQLHPWAACLF